MFAIPTMLEGDSSPLTGSHALSIQTECLARCVCGGRSRCPLLLLQDGHPAPVPYRIRGGGGSSMGAPALTVHPQGWGGGQVRAGSRTAAADGQLHRVG